MTERFGEEHHAKKKKTVGACIISPVPNNRPATAIDIIKTASFGTCHKLECDLGGKDAVYELCRAWMKDADIKSNFAQSLVALLQAHKRTRTEQNQGGHHCPRAV